VEHFHGNWPGEIPTVHRWPYDYSKPGAPADFIPQHISEQDLLDGKNYWDEHGDGGEHTPVAPAAPGGGSAAPVNEPEKVYYKDDADTPAAV
jgi:hypothetical protein